MAIMSKTGANDSGDGQAPIGGILDLAEDGPQETADLLEPWMDYLGKRLDLHF